MPEDRIRDLVNQYSEWRMLGLDRRAARVNVLNFDRARDHSAGG